MKQKRREYSGGVKASSLLAGLIMLFVWSQSDTVLAQHTGSGDNRTVHMLHLHIHELPGGDPVTGAHLWFEGSTYGAVSGRDGHARITIPGNGGTLVVSHVGYRTVRMAVDPDTAPAILHISLSPDRLPAEGELTVISSRAPAAHSGLYSDVKTRPVDDHLSGIAGVNLVSRTNFARDPVVRGMRDSRMEVVIDGMRMTPACVDGMDPLTAYLETDNLEAIEVNRSPGEGSLSAGASGGAINFRMARPAAATGFTGNLESGYHSVSRQQVHQGVAAYGADEWGIRLSGTYRQAGDMRAGEATRVEGSSLEKGNLYLSGFWQPGRDHRLTTRYVGDFAGFIGYPSLLMDTRRADAHLVGLEHEWSRPFGRVASLTSQIYMSRVVHRMDDYRRDPSDREVMRNMFMPMDGETRTAGVRSSMKMAGSSHLLELEMDSWFNSSWGDMQMIPTDPGQSEMSLLTMGDVANLHNRLTAAYTRYSGGGWQSGGSLQAELASNRLRDPGSRAVYRSELPELESLDPVVLTWVASLHVERVLSRALSLGSRVSYGSRQPGHMERYGYYIYQPLDGYFYLGNPGLDPERSAQAELYAIWGESSSIFSGRTAIWVNHLDRYIAGERVDSMFKRMQNMGSARLAGVEAELSLQMSRQWSAAGQMAWTWGEHRSLEEPLPMIAPLQGTLQLHWMDGPFAVEGRVRWAAAQNRVASVNHSESPTGGYAMADLFARWQLSGSLRLQAGVENMLDSFHADHLSVNRFPMPGRNIHASVRWSL